MSTMNAPRWRFPAGAALLAALALAGCSAGSDDATSTDPVESTSASGETSAEPTAAPEPTEEPPPSAADGTDFSNCDTQCEVEVTAGDVFEYDDFTLTVTDVTEDGIELSREDDGGGTGSTSISGGYCIAYLSANGSGSTCYGGVEGTPPAPEPADGEIAVELFHVTDGTAIIRITVS